MRMRIYATKMVAFWLHDKVGTKTRKREAGIGQTYALDSALWALLLFEHSILQLRANALAF